MSTDVSNHGLNIHTVEGVIKYAKGLEVDNKEDLTQIRLKCVQEGVSEALRLVLNLARVKNSKPSHRFGSRRLPGIGGY